MSFCRSTAKRIKRSLRRRSDRCHLSWWQEKVNYPTEDILQQKEKDTEISYCKDKLRYISAEADRGKMQPFLLSAVWQLKSAPKNKSIAL